MAGSAERVQELQMPAGLAEKEELTRMFSIT
jgi:hypothetical protein